MNLSILLWGIPQAMRVAARVYPDYAERLKEKDVVAQFKLRDKPEVGRWIKLDKGKISSGKGIHASPDIGICFKDEALAKSFLTPPFDMLERIDAAKNFKILLEGPDDLAIWFLATLARLESVMWKAGTDIGNGVVRYTNGTNGGPLFVYVKDGKILRTTPIDFERRRLGVVVRHGARQDVHAASTDDAGRARPVPEVHGVLEGPPALPDETGRFRSER